MKSCLHMGFNAPTGIMTNTGRTGLRRSRSVFRIISLWDSRTCADSTCRTARYRTTPYGTQIYIYIYIYIYMLMCVYIYIYIYTYIYIYIYTRCSATILSNASRQREAHTLSPHGPLSVSSNLSLLRGNWSAGFLDYIHP